MDAVNDNTAAYDTPTPSFLKSIRLENFLSFGPDTPALNLGPLNVLIGPNGSGKSNLLEAIALMRATPGDLQAVIRKGGGVAEWIYKGSKNTVATVELETGYSNKSIALKHSISFENTHQRFMIFEEHIVQKETDLKKYHNPLYDFKLDSGALIQDKDGQLRGLVNDPAFVYTSILNKRRDPDHYPELSYLASHYERIRIYTEWLFGKQSLFREPQQADLRNDRLEEDFSNLGLFLNRLRRYFPHIKIAVQEHLNNLYAEITDFDVSVEGGTVQLFFNEGNYTIPARRLSDGTLRYLCLLAILLDPTPPPLICIEEPELGLHPDMLIDVADLLMEASKRTQVIVTTHSDIIIDAMTEHPDAVVVCEKHEGKTHLERLNKDELNIWLEQYRLGELWLRGQIGGKRW